MPIANSDGKYSNIMIPHSPLQWPPAPSAMHCLERSSLRKKQSLVHIKQTSAGPHARSSPFHSATMVLLFLYYFCFITVTAELINPTCSKNVCTLPSNECVEVCPRNVRDIYFVFGLRSNKRCVRPSMPGTRSLGASNDTTMTDLLLVDKWHTGNVGSNETDALVQRQDLWPEYGPPDCYWGMCQFHGPPCILWCTEDKVHYGSEWWCKDRVVARSVVTSTAGRPLSLTALIVIPVVLLAMTSFELPLTSFR